MGGGVSGSATGCYVGVISQMSRGYSKVLRGLQGGMRGVNFVGKRFYVISERPVNWKRPFSDLLYILSPPSPSSPPTTRTTK